MPLYSMLKFTSHGLWDITTLFKMDTYQLDLMQVIQKQVLGFNVTASKYWTASPSVETYK